MAYFLILRFLKRANQDDLPHEFFGFWWRRQQYVKLANEFSPRSHQRIELPTQKEIIRENKTLEKVVESIVKKEKRF